MLYKQKILNELMSASRRIGLCYNKDFVIRVTENYQFGDYSLNICDCAKFTNKKPLDLGRKILKNLSGNFYNTELTNSGYLNFKLKNNILLNNLEKIILLKERFAKENIGKNKVVIIDYSSPNIAKPMSVGNIRSTIIGNALYNIYKYLGFKVIGDNHLGDWGTQFGKLIYAFKKWGKNKKNIDIQYLLWLYVKFHKEAKTNPKLEDYARYEFELLEKGDKTNFYIWQKFRKISIKEFNKIYKLLNIKFDKELGESFYNPMLKNIIDKAIISNIAIESEGALIIPFDNEENLPPLLIQKSDKTTLYATRDLATMEYRIKKYKPSMVIYVIGNEQCLYLKELFCAFKKMGYDKVKFKHVGFGLIRLKNEKMSSRSGNIIILEDLINQAIVKSRDLTRIKNNNITKYNLDRISRDIGIGAIKYNDLSQNRNTDIVFDLDKMLSFTGNSAPYLQYTYARARKILKNLNQKDVKIDKSVKIDESELKILKKLLHFSEVIVDSALTFEPNHLANYLFTLSNDYNYMYQKFSILKEPNIQTKILRISITKAIMIVLKTGLNLLGINTPQEL